MSIAARARKSARQAMVVGMAASMLAVAAPAHAGGVTLDSDTAIAAGGDGGNGGIGINVVALNCLLLLVDCGGGPFGGGDASGGAGGAANAQNIG
ncbi:MAG: hypothetical protein ACRDZO_26775 [Egibacteraceae bacterium]